MKATHQKMQSFDLPPEFDPLYYRERHPDIGHLSEAELLRHYERFGRREGRIATPAAHRVGFAQILPKESAGLEIGPACNPIARGSCIKYFDVMDQDQMVKRALRAGRPTNGCPHIHYVSPYGDLSIVPETFGFVLSAHYVEHQPDLIKHLSDVEKLLNAGGMYFLVIPDKRYCSDHFLRETTIADVIDAHLSGNQSHKLRNIIEHRAFTTHNDAARHWKGDHGAPWPENKGFQRVYLAVRKYREGADNYSDVHAWRFTPDSFRLLTVGMAALGYTALRPLRVYDTVRGRPEFCAVLGKTG